MIESRMFSLGTILSVTTGKLLCPMDNLYEILNFLTGEQLYTHQLPRAGDAGKPYILQQYPQLVKINAEEVTGDNWKAYLSIWCFEFGTELELKPIPKEEQVSKNPIVELDKMLKNIREDY
jgi:hypothetical protein